MLFLGLQNLAALNHNDLGNGFIRLCHWYRFLKINIDFNSVLGTHVNYFVNKSRPKHRAPSSNKNMHRTLLRLVVPNIAMQFNSAQPSVKVPVMLSVR